jgi:polyisoprenyl-teichoic acid--peptidoglycan teichoic acid transferase
MSGRVDELTLRRAARAAPVAKPAGHLLTAGQRFRFVLALSVFGVAALYCAFAMLTRVTPALVKGKDFTDIPIVGRAAASLPDVVRPNAPGAGSSYNERINILIIGVDKRPGWRDEDAYLTDVIMVASLDPLSKTVSILGFPRDIWTEINLPDGSHYGSRINNSYGVGFRRGNSIASGAEQLQRDMEINFGIKTKHWVWMDFKGVEGLVDAVGGVDIEVTQETSFYDWWYTDDDFTNPHYESFAPGIHHVNGYRAVAFGRYREDSDFVRVKRQQTVMRAAMQKVFAEGLLNGNIDDLYSTYAKFVRHNIPVLVGGGYLPLLKDTGGYMETYSLGEPVNGIETLKGFETEDGASVQEMNLENVRYWLEKAFPKTSYVRSKVEIENAMGGDAGANRANALGVYLKYSRALPDVSLGSDLPVRANTTIVLHDESRRQLAQDIAKWIGVADVNILIEPKTSETQPDVLVIIGQDFKLPVS